MEDFANHFSLYFAQFVICMLVKEPVSALMVIFEEMFSTASQIPYHYLSNFFLICILCHISVNMIQSTYHLDLICQCVVNFHCRWI